MIRIHLVTGNKGNIGKSLWASGLIEYYRSHGKKLIFIDGDKDSETLRNTYKDALIISLSDDPIMAAQPDVIMDIAEAEMIEENSGDILIDLPAGGEKVMNEWIEASGLDKSSEIADILPVNIFKWWVSDTDLESVQLFEKSVNAYPEIKHIFLKNMGRSRETQWKAVYEQTAIKALADAGKIKVLEIDVLAPETISLLRQLNMEMGTALSHKEVPTSKRLRVGTWLKRIAAKVDDEIFLGKENKDKPITSEVNQSAAKSDKKDKAAVAKK